MSVRIVETQEELDELIEKTDTNGKLLVVEIYDPYCERSRRAADMLERWANTEGDCEHEDCEHEDCEDEDCYGEEFLTFVRVVVDEDTIDLLFAGYCVPAYIFYRNGNQIDEFTDEEEHYYDDGVSNKVDRLIGYWSG